MTRFLQINTNRARLAYDLMTQHAIQLNVDVILITEPNVNKMGKEWIVQTQRQSKQQKRYYLLKGRVKRVSHG